MYALKAAAFVLALATVSAAYGQASLDDRYKISLSVNGSRVVGFQELDRMTAGLPRGVGASGPIYDANPPMVIAPGQSFQAVVSITDPSGNVADYTRSPRLRYETFCMTASTLGVITATPVTGEQCSLPEWPELWIELIDGSGNVIALNVFMFHIARSGPVRAHNPLPPDDPQPLPTQ
jgi:hypothetical protein